MNKTNNRRALGMFIASMLIFGTIGVFRRYIPLPSAFLAFVRGIVGGLFLLGFIRLRGKGASRQLPRPLLLRLSVHEVLQHPVLPVHHARESRAVCNVEQFRLQPLLLLLLHFQMM